MAANQLSRRTPNRCGGIIVFISFFLFSALFRPGCLLANSGDKVALQGYSAIPAVPSFYTQDGVLGAFMQMAGWRLAESPDEHDILRLRCHSNAVFSRSQNWWSYAFLVILIFPVSADMSVDYTLTCSVQNGENRLVFEEHAFQESTAWGTIPNVDRGPFDFYFENLFHLARKECSLKMAKTIVTTFQPTPSLSKQE